MIMFFLLVVISLYAVSSLASQRPQVQEEQSKYQRKKRSGKKEIDMNFVVSGIRFDSFEGSFRLTSRSNDEGNLELKLERLKTAQQWQMSISDVGEVGPAGLPKEAVSMALKNTVKLFSTGPIGEKKSSDGKIDIEKGDGGCIVLLLDIPFCGVDISFDFLFLPLAMEHIDEVETLLRDAHDDIEVLQRQMAQLTPVEVRNGRKPSIALRSSTACAQNQPVAWNVPIHTTGEGDFEMASDATSVVVKNAGVYQICMRLGLISAAGNGQLQISVNGRVVAVAYRYDGHNQHTSNAGTHYSSSTVSDIVPLSADDRVTVLHTSSHHSDATAVTSHLSIVQI